MAKIKKINWNELDKGVFMVNTLAVIFDTKTRKILIGKRENDPYCSKLTWCFPGGRPKDGDDLEKALENVIKEKTGLKVKNLGSVFSRVFKENKQILNIYYLCEVVGGKEKPVRGFKELKWVKPQELHKYFTTSFDKRLKEYVLGLK